MSIHFVARYRRNIMKLFAETPNLGAQCNADNNFLKKTVDLYHHGNAEEHSHQYLAVKEPSGLCKSLRHLLLSQFVDVNTAPGIYKVSNLYPKNNLDGVVKIFRICTMRFDKIHVFPKMISGFPGILLRAKDISSRELSQPLCIPYCA